MGDSSLGLACPAQLPCAVRPTRQRVAILGLGNLLMGDDGIGVRLARALHKKSRVGVAVVDVGTAILGSIPYLEWADRVLVLDAMQCGRSPGSIYFGTYAQLGDVSTGRLSHDRGLEVAIELCNRNQRPKEIYVFGVEPADIQLRWTLSPVLQKEIPACLMTLNRVLQCLRECPDTDTVLSSAVTQNDHVRRVLRDGVEFRLQ